MLWPRTGSQRLRSDPVQAGFRPGTITLGPSMAEDLLRAHGLALAICCELSGLYTGILDDRPHRVEAAQRPVFSTLNRYLACILDGMGTGAGDVGRVEARAVAPRGDSMCRAQTEARESTQSCRVSRHGPRPSANTTAGRCAVSQYCPILVKLLQRDSKRACNRMAGDGHGWDAMR